MDSYIDNIKNNKNLLLMIGITLGIAACIPYFIMGEGSVITYHDQLDGELITYLLNPKYLFSNIHTYPELMNGIPKTGMLSPAVFFVPLYALFNPFDAYMLTQVFIICFGFVSMFLLTYEISDKPYIAFLSGVAFMFIPYYPVYGLCIIGQPILWYAFYRIAKQRGSLYLNLALIALYALGSSLVLVGFACVMIAIAWTVYQYCTKNPVKHKLLLATCLLVVVYGITNLSLVTQVLGFGSIGLSHKSELVLQSVPFISHCVNIFVVGVGYAQSFQIIIIPLSIFAFTLAIVKKDLSNRKLYIKRFAWLYAYQIFITLCCGLMQSKIVIDFRNSIGGVIKEFNPERIAWTMPIVWFLILCNSFMILDNLRDSKQEKTIFTYVSLCCTLTISLFAIYRSDIKTTGMKMLKGQDYYAITWQQFFAKDLFTEIKEDIGLPTQDYRIVSFGIYPAAAAYNGFYCLDAYSNNYLLDYKHEFRHIIEPELQKSEYLQSVFDGWGNRCYITSAESMDYYTFERRWTPVTQDLDIDTKQLKKMGCVYIVSASYLMNADELGISLIRQEPYENDNSWYRLYVYHVD